MSPLRYPVLLAFCLLANSCWIMLVSAAWHHLERGGDHPRPLHPDHCAGVGLLDSPLSLAVLIRRCARSNHRDAWVFGAADPNSGTATMLEVARGFGKLLAQVTLLLV